MNNKSTKHEGKLLIGRKSNRVLGEHMYIASHIKDATFQQDIDLLTIELSHRYPIEAQYNSRCTLYQTALKDGVIDDETFGHAAKHYGRMWNYVGD